MEFHLSSEGRYPASGGFSGLGAETGLRSSP